MRRGAGIWWGVVLAAVTAVSAYQAIQPTAPGASAAALPGEAALSAAPIAAAQQEVRVGDPAPDFTLQDQDRQQVQLSQFRDRTVQVAFYVWAFSPG